MVPDDEEGIYQRVRYDPEKNVDFWGINFNSKEFEWVHGGYFALASANNSLYASGVAFAFFLTTTLSIMF